MMKKAIRPFAFAAALALFAWCLPSATAAPLPNPQQTSPGTGSGVQPGAAQPGSPETGAAGREQRRAVEQQQEEQDNAQQAQQGSQAQAEQEILLTGKVTRENGHEMFTSSDTHKPMRISNPSKVKKYNGEMVKVEGTVNPKSHRLHVSKVTPATS